MGAKQTVSELVEAVENGKEFLEWRKSDRNGYLSSVFIMAEGVGRLSWEEPGGKDGKNEWLLSYYSKGDDTFTTFSSTGAQKSTKEEAFKKGKALPHLDTAEVKLQVWDGIKKAEDLREKSYKGGEPTKVIAILQPLTSDEIFGSDSGNGSNDGKGNSSRGTVVKTKTKNSRGARPVWNITYITASFNVLNVKVDAETGKVLSHRLSGVMDFTQKDK